MGGLGRVTSITAALTCAAVAAGNPDHNKASAPDLQVTRLSPFEL